MEGSESPIQIPGTKHIWVYIQVRDCTVYMLNCTIYTLQIPGTKHIWVYNQVLYCTVYMVHCTVYTEQIPGTKHIWVIFRYETVQCTC